MKKIISLVLSLLIITTQFVNVFAWTLSDQDGNIIGNQTPEAEQEVDSAYEKWDILEFMYAVGAFDENVISYSMLDSKISKLTFISAIAGIYFNDDSSAGIPERIFSDVPEDHYAATDVARLVGLGMINGKDDGTLGADDEVSLDMAYAMVVRMLGYSQYADALGAYPKGSNEVARKLDITIDIEEYGAITVREALQLLYNALDAQMLVLTGAEGDRFNYEQGKVLLEERMGITKKRGIVYSSGTATISGSTAGEGNALIGGDSLSDSEGYAHKYLGYNTEYFINEDDELLWVMPYRTSEKTLYTSEDLSYENGYLKHGDKTVKKEKISVGEISILDNGAAAASINDIVPEYGEVKLIDNDNDNAYEVAIVYDYEVYYLSSMSKDKKELRLESGNRTIVKNLNDYDNVTLMDESGEELSALKAKSVVMAAENGSCITIVQCEQSIGGTVTSFRNDDAKKYFVIDDEEIQTTETVYYDGWDAKTLPKTINAYLDKYGNIAAVFAAKNETKEEWKIGWLLRTAVDESGDEVFVGIVESEYADYKLYQLADKFKLDGKQINLRKTADRGNLISERGIIRYLISGDRIAAIDFPQDRSFAEGGKIVDNEYDKLYRRMSGRRYYVDSQGTLVNNNGNNQNNPTYAGDGNVYFGSGSVIFDAPARDDVLAATEDYIAIIKKDDFTDHVDYEVDAYAIGGNSTMTDVLVVYGHNLAAGSTSTSGAALVVAKITEGLDDEDSPTQIITGYVMGSKVQYFISEDGLKSDTSYGTVTNLSTVKPGDVIKFTTDRHRRIDWVQKMWSGDGAGYVNKYGWTHENIFEMYRYADAHVVNYSDGILGYKVTNGNFEMCRIGDAPVYVYDRNAERDHAYAPASKTDLELAVSNPDIYETVLVGSYQTFVKEVILIKK